MGTGAEKKPAYKTFGGVVYELNDSVAVSPRQVSMLLRDNGEAFREFKIARSENSIAAGLRFTGGILMCNNNLLPM